MSDVDEQWLLSRVPSGDDRAFEAVYRLFETRVRLVAWRISRRLDIVDDLTNEAWCRAYSLRPQYDPQRSFLNWIGGILQNVWREYARTHRNDGERLAAGAPRDNGDPSGADSPERAVAEAEVLALLNDCLGELSEEERNLIRWRFFENQSLRSVAQRLGIAEATVRENRLPAVMAKMQRFLKARGVRDDFFSLSAAQGGPDLQYRHGDTE